MGAGIDWAVLPAVGAWALAFAVVQTVAGVALLVGSLILALAFGGRYASVDSLAGRLPGPLRLPRRLSPVLLLAAVPAGVAAVVLGIEPGEYEESLAAVAGAVVAGFCGLLGFVGLAQRGPPERVEGKEREAPAGAAN